jgi:hypothetical protein
VMAGWDSPTLIGGILISLGMEKRKALVILISVGLICLMTG